MNTYTKIPDPLLQSLADDAAHLPRMAALEARRLRERKPRARFNPLPGIVWLLQFRVAQAAVALLLLAAMVEGGSLLTGERVGDGNASIAQQVNWYYAHMGGQSENSLNPHGVVFLDTPKNEQVYSGNAYWGGAYGSGSNGAKWSTNTNWGDGAAGNVDSAGAPGVSGAFSGDFTDTRVLSGTLSDGGKNLTVSSFNPNPKELNFDYSTGTGNIGNIQYSGGNTTSPTTIFPFANIFGGGQVGAGLRSGGQAITGDAVDTLLNGQTVANSHRWQTQLRQPQVAYRGQNFNINSLNFTGTDAAVTTGSSVTISGSIPGSDAVTTSVLDSGIAGITFSSDPNTKIGISGGSGAGATAVVWDNFTGQGQVVPIAINQPVFDTRKTASGATVRSFDGFVNYGSPVAGSPAPVQDGAFGFASGTNTTATGGLGLAKTGTGFTTVGTGTLNTTTGNTRTYSGTTSITGGGTANLQNGENQQPEKEGDLVVVSDASTYKETKDEISRQDSGTTGTPSGGKNAKDNGRGIAAARTDFASKGGTYGETGAEKGDWDNGGGVTNIDATKNDKTKDKDLTYFTGTAGTDLILLDLTKQNDVNIASGTVTTLHPKWTATEFAAPAVPNIAAAKPAEKPVTAPQAAGGVIPPPLTDARKLIRNATLDFEVASFEKALDTVGSVAAEEQGYILTQDSAKGENGKLQGTIIVKVLPGNLDRFLLKLRLLGDLKSQNVTGQDVTKEYYDTESRIRNAQVTEQRLIEMMKTRTGKVSELLEVENEIAKVRGEIEQMQGTLKYMDGLVQYATVTITLREKDLNQAAAYLLTEQAQLYLFVKDVETAFAQAKTDAADAKAQVLESHIERDEAGHVVATLHLLLPPDGSEDTIGKLKAIGRIQHYNSQTQRVARDGSNGAPSPSDTAKVDRDKVDFSMTIQRDGENPVQGTNISVQTDQVEDKTAQIKQAAADDGVEVKGAEFNRAQNGAEVSAMLLRMPMRKYQAFLEKIKSLGKVKVFTVARREDDTATGDAPAEIVLQIFSQGNIVADNTGLWATARHTIGQGFSALMWSLRMIGVTLAFTVPWAIIAAVVWFTGGRRWLLRKK